MSWGAPFVHGRTIGALFSPSLNLVEAETKETGSCDFIVISAFSNRTMTSSQSRLILGPVEYSTRLVSLPVITTIMVKVITGRSGDKGFTSKLPVPCSLPPQKQPLKPFPLLLCEDRNSVRRGRIAKKDVHERESPYLTMNVQV